ncbi:MAG: hypothetical protein ACSLFM_08885 [Tepidiformaceae bacterium]
MYLAAFALLGELLGSTADSTQTFTDHFADDATRFGDIAGALLLVVAAVFLVALGLTLWRMLATEPPSLRIDLIGSLAIVVAAALVASAALLVAPPLLQSFGDLFDDPGMEPGATAGIAQAGSVGVILCAMLLGGWTVLFAVVAYGAGVIGRRSMIAACVVGGLSLLAITVGAAAPLGVWWLVVGLRWRESPAPISA